MNKRCPRCPAAERGASIGDALDTNVSNYFQPWAYPLREEGVAPARWRRGEGEEPCGQEWFLVVELGEGGGTRWDEDDPFSGEVETRVELVESCSTTPPPIRVSSRSDRNLTLPTAVLCHRHRHRRRRPLPPPSPSPFPTVTVDCALISLPLEFSSNSGIKTVF
ncbi:hypothetical protein QVD17_00277 [Tagetes erecta]|uniref:Uncharacterized protein n=1 Tax=Tagetes erecta TaxID=13708 RepID=A0AAD8LBA5_TARER|nr:hypothetical protein QVD17_00277 [Tagetes erecta]